MSIARWLQCQGKGSQNGCCALTYVAFTPGDISSPADIVRNPRGVVEVPFDTFTALPIGIARTRATDPDVLLMDEPASALDPASTAKIEDLMFELSFG